MSGLIPSHSSNWLDLTVVSVSAINRNLLLLTAHTTTTWELNRRRHTRWMQRERKYKLQTFVIKPVCGGGGEEAVGQEVCAIGTSASNKLYAIQKGVYYYGRSSSVLFFTPPPSSRYYFPYFIYQLLLLLPLVGYSMWIERLLCMHSDKFCVLLLLLLSVSCCVVICGRYYHPSINLLTNESELIGDHKANQIGAVQVRQPAAEGAKPS